jgi:hypothetical protein
MTSVTIRSIEESLQQVLARWKKAFTQFDELRQASRSAVVRWEWTEFERYSLLPFYFKRYPGRGRVLTEPTDKIGFYYRYGLDELNRPRIHIFYNYVDFHGREIIQQDRHRYFDRDDLGETFYTYTDILAEIIEFSVPPRIPLKVQQIFIENGRVIRHASFRLNGYTPLYSEKGSHPDALYEWLGYNGRFKLVEKYVYAGSRLTSIQLYSETPGIAPYKTEEHFFYDDAGRLLRIEQLNESEQRHLLYKKREKGQTFKSIRQAAIQKLIEAIVERLRTEHISEKLCCIELFYQSGSSHFPPTIFLCREADRQALLASNNPEAKYYIFSPGLMGEPWYLEITDPDVLEICSQLEQEIQSGQKWDAATGILREVAAALTHFDWRNSLNITPDFVVFAIDWEVEGDHLADVLRASASKDQLREWKAKGWL